MKAFVNKLRALKVIYQDRSLGRQCVGQDAVGNKFYQYNTLKREIVRKQGSNLIEIDPLWQRWTARLDEEVPVEAVNYSLDFNSEQREEHDAMKRWEELLQRVKD
jgi:NADH:ubiquinone oxidoreductase subunit